MATAVSPTRRKSVEECIERAKEAIVAWFADAEAAGEAIPAETTRQKVTTIDVTAKVKAYRREPSYAVSSKVGPWPLGGIVVQEVAGVILPPRIIRECLRSKKSRYCSSKSGESGRIRKLTSAPSTDGSVSCHSPEQHRIGDPGCRKKLGNEKHRCEHPSTTHRSPSFRFHDETQSSRCTGLPLLSSSTPRDPRLTYQPTDPVC